MAVDARQTSARRVVVATAALSTMLAPLNSTMIVVALPRILAEFHRSLAWGSWIVTSYLVAMAAVQPLAGSLGDRYGRRRLMVAGLLCFLGATLLAATAGRIEILLLARTAQAVAGAAAIPNGVALLRQTIPLSDQGRANGIVGSAIAVAAGLGPPIGGLVTDGLGWRWIFVFNLLLIVPALWLLSRLPPEPASTNRRPFDLQGAALLTIALVTLVLALTVWRVPAVPIGVAPLLGLLAIAATASLWRHARRASNPLLNLSLFRAPGFGPAVSAVLLSNLAMYTVLLSLPIFLERRAGWSSRETGLLLAGLSLQMIVFSPVGGRISDVRGRRFPAVAGALLATCGLVPLLAIDPGWTWRPLVAALIVIGVGMGLSTAPIQTSAILAVPSERAGQASGLFSTFRYFGSITGSTLLAVILTGETPTVSHLRLLYVVLVAASAGAVLVCARLPGPASSPSPIVSAEPNGVGAKPSR